MDENKQTPEEEFNLDEIMKLIDEQNSATTDTEPAQEIEETQSVTENADNAETTEVQNVDPRQGIVYYLHDLAYLMVAIVLIFLLLFRVVVVSGDSMYDTLVDGDYLLLQTNLIYHDPKPGDIVVISKADYDSGKPIVKRIIATEGQIVDIDFITGKVYVDGVLLEESYIFTKTTLDEGVAFPHEVGKGCVFVLGDNRGRSKDSRDPEIGDIDCRQIVGKAVVLIYPGSDSGTVAREWGRIGVIG